MPSIDDIAAKVYEKIMANPGNQGVGHSNAHVPINTHSEKLLALTSFPKDYDQALIKAQERLIKGGIYDVTLFNLPAKP
jgi:hypothetical protein